MSTVDKITQYVDIINYIANRYNIPLSKESLSVAAHWSPKDNTSDFLRFLARKSGLSFQRVDKSKWTFSAWRLPVVIELDDGSLAVMSALSPKGEVSLFIPGEVNEQSAFTLNNLKEKIINVYLLRPLKNIPDERVDDYLKPYQQHWLLRIILNDLKPYSHILAASLFANVLALAGIFFTRQVYDRVVPAESYVTLYVLFSGVLVAVVFEYVLRVLRIRISDYQGKRADLRISDLIFGRALYVENMHRPKSSGVFVAKVRDLESVREVLTSSTVMLVADLPFFFLFLFVFWHMAGPLTFIPLVALVAMVLPSLLSQPALARLSRESLRESTLRNAMLVESIQGLEDIKILQAEPKFQHRWNHYNHQAADVGLRLRFLINSLTVWSNTVQSLVFVCVVLFGAPMVMEGSLTVGVLVAASILSSRMIAPLGQLTQLLIRWQQAKNGYNSLNSIMKMPVDGGDVKSRVYKPLLSGNYQLNNVVFSYDKESEPVIKVNSLSIKAGEKIAVLGRNGAGKSTVLQLLAGLLNPQSGEVLLDGINLAHLDPQDVRRDVGLLTQNARLFYGTIRENICLGAPQVTEEELLHAVKLSGADAFIKKLPLGLNHKVFEGGGGLSGGQRQSLLLARLFIRKPQIVLMDEPTSALDDVTEVEVINNLKNWLDDKTLILVTHKKSLLSLVDRVVVMDNGNIVLDADKMSFLQKIQKKK